MSPTDVKDRSIKPERPFELATCDHYLCNMFCKVMVANNKVYAMKPWLTVLRDIATASVLALWLRLAAPSKRSVALVTRQCVRSHGRLPEAIIEDNGSDFASVFNSALAAHYGYSLIFRPTGHPRYGSEAERFFGQFKELWLSGRPGNLVNQTEVRAVSGSHRPEMLATMTLLDLWQELLTFNTWFDNYTTDSKLGSPAALTREGFEKYSCSGIKVEYDDEFVVATAVDVGKYKLDPQRGLHIGAFHYWCPALARETRSRILVRIDPQDPYRVYALTDDHWVTCFASAAPSYGKRSPLQQVVEGAIQLDRNELTKAMKEDSDRLLVRAMQSCDVEHSKPRPQTEDVARVMLRQDSPEDLFAQVKADQLPELEEVPW